MLDVLAFVASLTRERLPNKASQFLEIAEDPPGSMPLIYELTSPEPIRQTNFFI